MHLYGIKTIPELKICHLLLPVHRSWPESVKGGLVHYKIKQSLVFKRNTNANDVKYCYGRQKCCTYTTSQQAQSVSYITTGLLYKVSVRRHLPHILAEQVREKRLCGFEADSYTIIPSIHTVGEPPRVPVQ